ncbi:hypothetical protein M758_12G115900 [Ceratodon purpureus]|nr:hypothetical protein M758_12G115900 [Ceratodon purpureus]
MHMPTTSLDSPAIAKLHNPSNITEVIMDSDASEVNSMLERSNIDELQNNASSASYSTPHTNDVQPRIPRQGQSIQIARARTIHQLRNELQQPARVLLPSFTKRLVSYNVHDGAGNTCGAILEVPSSFLRAHAIQLEAAHVRLQGICEESPVRAVTANSRRPMHNPDGEPILYLGWGDFVRENVLRAGQELVFTLAAESFFEVREVRGTAI